MRMLDHIFSLVLCLINVGCQSPKGIFHGPWWKAEQGTEFLLVNKRPMSGPVLASLLGVVGANGLDTEACSRPPCTGT